MCIDCLYAEDIAPTSGRGLEADVLLWGPGGVEVPAVFAWYDEDPRADPINPRRRLVTFDNPNGRAMLAFDTMDVADFIAAVHHEIESAAAEAAAMKGQQ